jgi:F-type H+-transporting ATPase subunit delta
MIGSAVGKRYATALFELAEQANAIDQVGNDLRVVASAFDSNAELKNVFQNPGFGIEVKKQVVEALVQKAKLHGYVRNVLMLLVERRRLGHAAEIADAFQRIAEKRAGVIRAEIVVAKELSETYYAELQKRLEQATGKKVVLVRRVDPSLIGGVVTTVEGRVFDGSLKNRLRELKNQLLAAADPARRLS